MRTSGGMAVALAITGIACFSTARYDTAHTQRVFNINARYDAESQRHRASYATSLAALDQLRTSIVAIAPGSRPTPLHRVDQRRDIVACRSECAQARCLREICQPAYAAALIGTYASADLTWVTDQLAASGDADLESLLAFSHNQTVQRAIDTQAQALEQLQDQARRLQHDRELEIHASIQLRDSEIESGRAAHRARVKAAADAFTAMDHAVPTTARTTVPHFETREPREPSRDACAQDAGCNVAR